MARNGNKKFSAREGSNVVMSVAVTMPDSNNQEGRAGRLRTNHPIGNVEDKSTVPELLPSPHYGHARFPTMRMAWLM